MSTKCRTNTILFTGGGTGGHVFPGIALLETLQKKGYQDFAWIGSCDGPERAYVKDNPVAFHAIPTGKFRRYFSLKNLTDPFKVLYGIACAYRLLCSIRPKAVISIGGFVSVPVVLAAAIHGIPVVSIIYGLSFSLASKINKRFTKLLLFSYKQTADDFVEHNTSLAKKTIFHVTGNPVRQNILYGDPDMINKQYHLSSDKKMVVCFGGSSGAAQLNAIVLELKNMFSSDVVLFHQTGHHHDSDTDDVDILHTPTHADTAQYFSKPFYTDEYAPLLARADVVISRAGASALWEIAAIGVPSIIIPLSAATSRGDQLENAQFFAKNNAVINMGPCPDTKAVYDTVYNLLYDDTLRTQLYDGCMAFQVKNAAECAVNHILDFFNT